MIRIALIFVLSVTIAYAAGRWQGDTKGYDRAVLEGTAQYAEAQEVWRNELVAHYNDKELKIKLQRDGAVKLAEKLKNRKPKVVYRNVKTPDCSRLGDDFVRMFNDARQVP